MVSDDPLGEEVELDRSGCGSEFPPSCILLAHLLPKLSHSPDAQGGEACSSGSPLFVLYYTVVLSLSRRGPC